ncbi:MAG: SDR family oxidoreductase [Deltaproteobacteria bacterium]|nr:MAG: SDR family oxidoreductase [Deltaproteobacteria bacterium]
MIRLDNAGILLTGASRGIGKALALTLAGTGAFLSLVARDEAGVRQTSQEIIRRGGRALPLTGDVSRPEAVFRLVRQAQEAMGQIDILVNVAGIQAPIGPFHENDLATWEKIFKVNFFGALHLIHTVLPQMMVRRRGKIINFSGGGATAPRPNFSAYAASKAALVRFTETLAEELKPYNIQVNAVAPGAVNTQMLDEVLAAGEKAGAEYHQARERTRTGGTPVELVCELVKFLASQASGALTGKLISAPHDPWREWQDKVEELNETPMFTVRRLDPFTIKPLIKNLR